jgi:hypothetical protein
MHDLNTVVQSRMMYVCLLIELPDGHIRTKGELIVLWDIVFSWSSSFPSISLTYRSLIMFVNKFNLKTL